MPDLVKISLFINTLLILYYIFVWNIHEVGSALMCSNKETNLVTGEYQDFKDASLLLFLFFYFPLGLFFFVWKFGLYLGQLATYLSMSGKT
jgi:hypothetical protein